MPTEICFAGENVRVTVEEEPGQVAEAFASARGLPCRLTARAGRGEVYVNPSTVAFWFAPERPGESGPPSEVPHKAVEPATKRQAVTNIWGQPVRRKPRQ